MFRSMPNLIFAENPTKLQLSINQHLLIFAQNPYV